MDENERSKIFKATKGVNDLTNDELIKLGEGMAEYMLYTIEPYYESWEFESEDLPGFTSLAEKVGLITRRKTHAETYTKRVYED